MFNFVITQVSFNFVTKLKETCVTESDSVINFYFFLQNNFCFILQNKIWGL